MSDLGVSFSPFNQDAKPQNQAQGSAAPVQDAIKILSLRQPTVAGASAPAPQALLGGPTVQGSQMGAEGLLAMLRKLLLGPTAGATPGAAQGAPPPPSSFGTAGAPSLPVSVNFGNGGLPIGPTDSTPSAPPSQPMPGGQPDLGNLDRGTDATLV